MMVASGLLLAPEFESTPFVAKNQAAEKAGAAAKDTAANGSNFRRRIGGNKINSLGGMDNGDAPKVTLAEIQTINSSDDLAQAASRARRPSGRITALSRGQKPGKR